MQLYSPTTAIPGVGEAITGKLAKLGISSVFDLLYHLPSRYENRIPSNTNSRPQPGEQVTLNGRLNSLKNEFTRNGKFIQKALLENGSGTFPVIWFNQPFLVKALKDKSVSLYGKVDFFGSKPTLISPDYEFYEVGQPSIHTNRIVPIYPETAGISSKWLRTKIHNLLDIFAHTDIFPAIPDLSPWSEALHNVHFPKEMTQIATARDRLSFDELFLLQLQSLQNKKLWNKTILAHSLTIDQAQIQEFINRLPFTLTGSQQAAIKTILADLSRPIPTNRLLEGDVGSGKTIVAALCMYVSHLNGFQSVLLAPTQILAAQHHQTLSSLFRTFDISTTLVTSQSSPCATSPILVGTHALLTEKNQHLFTDVGVVVIDEQHRFGVAQRTLASQLGTSPHILTMTATPIPRTIALTMFGDLDVSVLTDKPIGRLPIKTWVVPENKRTGAYDWIKKQLADTQNQVYWVCPFIEDSESASTVKAATTHFQELKNHFPKLSIGLLHGRQSAKEKDKNINDFRSGQTRILVATPIIEVGIDIPAATIMIIEAADRFGLAQLHQLRGRVGRSNTQSYCLLFSSGADQLSRLKAMEQYDNGLQLAEIDLKLRGPGQMYGTAQHGIPQFKVATFDNLHLIEKAKNQAELVQNDLDKYPVLRDLLKTAKITFVQPN